MELEDIDHRDKIPAYLESRGLTGYGVEVGVQYGSYLSVIKAGWPSAKHLFGVDPWRHLENYIDIANTPDSIQVRTYLHASLKSVKEGNTLLRMTSKEAAAEFKRRNVKFDFVYIDSNHTTLETYDAMLEWSSLLTANGVLAGHDYMDASLSYGDFGVKTAVDKFILNQDYRKNVDKEGGTLQVTKESHPSWIIEFS